MVITVSCPSCEASFPVDPSKIPQGGVNARCSACGEIFRVERPREPEPEVRVPADVAVEAPPEAAGETGAGADDALDAAPPVEPTAAEATERAPSSVDAPDDWVIDTEEDVDPDSLDIAPAGTVQQTVDAAQAEATFFGGAGDEPVAVEEPAPEVDVPEPVAEPVAVEEPAPEADVPEPVAEPVAMEEPAPEAEAAPESGPAAPVRGFTFGRQDPHDKAKRLARVLVSDMIMYHADRHSRALEAGTLREDFEDEIEKSWKEYVEQVGEEIANSTTYWTEALNDVLAQGDRIFG